MPRSGARLLWPVAFVVAAAVAASCGDKSTAPVVTSASPELPPVDEPENLAGTLVLRDGGDTWVHLRKLAGDHAALLPTTLGAAVATVTGLPVTTAELFSEHDPVVGAALEPVGGGPPLAVIAFRLRGADRVLMLATHGQDAAFVAHREPVTNGDLLDRIGASGAGAPALGVFGNYLVVGTTPGALTALGPFVSRNLAGSPSSGSPVEVKLKPGVLKLLVPLLRARKPEAASPGGVLEKLALDDLLATAERSDAASLGVTLSDDGALCTLHLAGKPGAVASAGPIADLLALPQSAELGLVAFETEERRLAEASSITALTEGRLGAEDRTALSAAFESLTKARGDGFALGFEDGRLGPAFYGRVAIRDRDRAAHALGALVDLSGKKTVAESLLHQGIAVSAKDTVVERLGDVIRVRIGGANDEKAPTVKATTAIDLFLRMGKDELTLGSGADAAAAIRAMSTGPTLATDTGVATMFGKLPHDGSFALFVDPARLETGETAPRSILVAGAKSDDAGTEITVALDDRAARALLDAATR